jgi:hypothetical protein
MITYPLVIPGPPATPAPNKVNPKMFDAVGEFISPFSGGSQQQQNQDQHWELDLDWPEMTWAQFAPLAAFAGALHGKWGSFLWGPPLATAPQGSGLGMPIAAGSDVSGSNILTTQAWLPNESGVLLPGDYLQLGVAGSFPIFAVQVADGQLIIIFAPKLTVAQLATLQSGPVQFVGAVAATWLAGWGFTFASSTQETDQTTVYFNLPPAYGTGGVIPGTYDASETGASAMFFFPRLYQYVNLNPLKTDGGGNASIDIFPALHEAPPAGAPLILLNPQGTFRMAENRRETPTTKTKTLSLQMKCREAI